MSLASVDSLAAIQVASTAFDNFQSELLLDSVSGGKTFKFFGGMPQSPSKHDECMC